jgi:ATP-dependent DNA helicase RecG
MTQQELQGNLRGESNSIEWKRGGDPKEIVKTLVAFANAYESMASGVVLCGVEEIEHADRRTTPSVVGISESDSRKLRNRIFELSKTLASPPIELEFDSVALDTGKEVLVVRARRSSEVHAFNGKVVVRLGDKTTDATTKQIAELAQRKSNLDWLAQPCPGATVDDISPFALEAIAQGHRPPGGTQQLLEPGFQMFGSVPPLINGTAGQTGDIVSPNRFAMLLVGKEPQRFMRGAFVAFTRFLGVTRADSIFSSVELFGPIPLLIQKVKDLLSLETGFIVDKTVDIRTGRQNRWRYSEDALQEILVNTFAHRDYQDHHSTKIYVFSDRIEFESPGGLVGPPSLEEAKHGRTSWRNPTLARYLVALGLAQERGTGLPKAIELTKFVSGVEPIFRVDEALFKVTVPAYHLPVQKTNGEPVSPKAGVLLISIGYGTIDPSLIRRSDPAFQEMADDRILTFHHPGIVAAEQWPELIREIRNWLRDRMEDHQFQEFHLFYRGPVAVGPLIGALSVARKPLIVYAYEEDLSLYRLAYRLDRRLLLEP